MGEFVERPSAKYPSRHNLPIDDLIATATNGKAVRLAANQINKHTRSLVSYHARIRGYRSHVVFACDTAIVWWDRR